MLITYNLELLQLVFIYCDDEHKCDGGFVFK